MARDYKHRAEPRAARRTAGWVWLFAGYLLGAFTVGLLWLKYTPSDAGGWIGAEPAGPTARPETSDNSAAGQPTQPRFDFYTLLPEMEVVVPEEELAESEPAPKQTVSTPPAPTDRAQYLLQVGSFRKAADADRLKAQLALLGFASQIQRAATPQSGVWHRVRTGPYADTAALRAARERLEANGHRTLVIRIPG